jgi:hypothetical protein
VGAQAQDRSRAFAGAPRDEVAPNPLVEELSVGSDEGEVPVRCQNQRQPLVDEDLVLYRWISDGQFPSVLSANDPGEVRILSVMGSHGEGSTHHYLLGISDLTDAE